MIVKKVEAFVKALDESEKMNKIKENDEVKSYISFTKEELAELKNKEYNALKDQMAAELSNTFGIDEEKAREIYGQRGRKKYTVEIKKVLMSLGME